MPAQMFIESMSSAEKKRVGCLYQGGTRCLPGSAVSSIHCYRPEIDGLRALAVLPVILFHAGFETFRGGFVGVDIFFVISGYLITAIILKELQSGEFSLIKFYERRARRILPALFLVIFTCMPIAWFLLLPPSMKSFSESLVAVSIFASNILFWRTSGYFDPASELKPLLHTWSLSVEEQFYILFPLFLLFLSKMKRRFIAALFAVVLIISMGLAEKNVQIAQSAAFYLLPTRAWELLVGACLSCLVQDTGTARVRVGWLNEIVGSGGVLLILISIFAFDRQTPFPHYALLPTLGTSMVLLCATRDNNVGKLLGNSLWVGIGLISYSAYLWHQPLLAFVKYGAAGELPDTPLLVFAVVLSFALAYFSWKYVEVPCRVRNNFSRTAVFICSLGGSCFLLILGLLGHFTSGHQWRYSHQQTVFLDHFDNRFPDWKYAKRENWYANYRIECDLYDISRAWAGNETRLKREIPPHCFTRDKEKWPNAILIWGDSHAQQFYFGLKEVLPSTWQILQIASSGCKPSLLFDAESTDYCDNSNQLAIQTIMEAKPEVVLVGQEKSHNAAVMNQIADALIGHGVKKVIFVGPSPHWREGGLPVIVAFRLWNNVPLYTKVGLDQKILIRDKTIKEQFINTSNVKYISLVDYFCGPDGCRVYLGSDVREGITSYDYGHLTPVASLSFARDVLKSEILM
ncbi:acyltransferase family protein [Candidatus Nitrospira inopinata]|nr:acyltransferase family protein [Candidatus Nitrospira inopinata]